jgi:SAM-dependent methyltransferase
VTTLDKSNGYEEIAPDFIARRGEEFPGIGASQVADWSKALPDGAAVLDLGCGTGAPLTKTLIERGFHVYGVDASATMVAAFRAKFSSIPVQCGPVEDSDFFGRTFAGVVSWGLFFLLEEAVQRRLIAKIAAVLPTGGRLLFTAPRQCCTWKDALTDRPSLSLGYEAYKSALEAEGLLLVENMVDVGENYYYSALKV